MRRLLRVEVLVPALGTTAFLSLYGPIGAAAGRAAETRWIGAGLLLAPALMVYAHRAAAAGAAVLGAVLWTALSGPAPGGRPATIAVVWAYAGAAILIAHRERPAATEPVVPHRPPPVPAAPLPRVAARAEATGRTLLAAAGLGLACLAAGSAAAPWWCAVIAAGGLGGALKARARRDRRALRHLFADSQPMHAVRVVEQLGYVHVLWPAEDGQTAREFGFDIAELDRPADEDEPHTRAAVLYGEPRPGRWCALEVDGRLHVPLGPVGEVIEVPYDVVQALPREIEDDEEQLVDPAALRPADGGLDAFSAREYRISPQRAWVATVAVGLGAALAAGELAELSGRPPAPAAAVLVAIAAAAGYEFGWRTQLRPRLRWHAGGVATVGFAGPDRQPWATDSAVVHDDEGTVLLTAGASVLTVPVPPPWPSSSAQRDAAQLVAALRDCRARSFEISPLPPPPEIDVPRRPALLYPAWICSVALTVLVFS